MGQLVLAEVPVERWVIDSYEYGLLYDPGNCTDSPAQSPAYNGKNVHIDVMPCRMTMLVNGGVGPKVFLKPVPKGPSLFPNVSLIAACLCTLMLVDYPTPLHDGVLVLGGYKQVMYSVFPYEVNLYSYFIAHPFETLTNWHGFPH